MEPRDYPDSCYTCQSCEREQFKPRLWCRARMWFLPRDRAKRAVLCLDRKAPGPNVYWYRRCILFY